MKDLKWKIQKGICAICGKELPVKGAELDRTEAKKGYMDPDNVRLVHQECHRADQEKKGYK